MKRVFILLLCVSFSFSYAAKVEISEALKAATNYAKGQPQQSAGRGVRAATTQLILAKDVQPESNYYIFNINADGGFVIVAGDDVAVPVLGYATSGNYDADNLPPAFLYWLNCLHREIETAVNNNVPQSLETAERWDDLLDEKQELIYTATPVVSPLVKTQWNQYEPYNNLCPLWSNMRTVTGCVATAMAQLMKYWDYPATGIGSSEPYNTKTRGIAIPALSYEIAYDWANMINTYSSSPTSTQNAAVATLMYHCGVSVEMDYDLANNGGSGAVTKKVANALYDHFDYDHSIQHKERGYYSDVEWTVMLKEQLQAGQPVLYAGRNSSSGHAFICDGYDTDSYFHFNWGWGGSQDGYFVLNALNPGSGGAGSGAGTYNLDQSLILNIKPNESGMETYEIKLYKGVGLSSTHTVVDRGELFTVQAPYMNEGFNDFAGDFGIALTDDSDNILEVLGQFSYTLLAGRGWYTSGGRSLSCGVSSDIDPGRYHLRAVAKLTDADGWFIVFGEYGANLDRLDLEVTANIVPDNSFLRLYNVGEPDGFTVNTALPAQGGDLQIATAIWNSGSSEFIGKLELGLYRESANSDLTLMQIVDTKTVSMQNGYYYNVVFNLSKLKLGGHYKLMLYAKSLTGTRTLVSDYSIYHNKKDLWIVPTLLYVKRLELKNGFGYLASIDNELATITLSINSQSYKFGSLSYVETYFDVQNDIGMTRLAESTINLNGLSVSDGDGVDYTDILDTPVSLTLTQSGYTSIYDFTLSDNPLLTGEQVVMREPVRVEYFTVTGLPVSKDAQGVLIVKTTYDDGSVETQKQINFRPE